MKVLDTCSGIGMAALGLEMAGMTIEAFCEFDPKPREVLAKHWPGVPIYPDLTTLTAEQLKNDGITADVISAGIPCQPHSRANKARKGRDDDRDLSRCIVELVETAKPAIFLGENTEGFIDTGLAPMLDDLEKIGYYSVTFSIPACSVGLPTLERHIWIVSSPDQERCERIAQKTFQIFDSLQEQFQGSDTRIPERWHLPESRVCRVGERNPSRMDRLEQIGNAVDPLVVKVLGQAIMATQ